MTNERARPALYGLVLVTYTQRHSGFTNLSISFADQIMPIQFYPFQLNIE